MSGDFHHDLLNLLTAATLHLYEADDCSKKGKHAQAGEHIAKALSITKQINTFVRKEATK